MRPAFNTSLGWRRAALGCALLNVIACSSNDESQAVTVVVDTNYGPALVAVIAAVTDAEGDPLAEHRFEAREHAWPLSFAVVTDEGQRELWLRLQAIGPNGIWSERVARADIQTNVSLAVPVFLDAGCRTITCPGSQTCTELGCGTIDALTHEVEPGRELQGLCRPGESWCDADGETLHECVEFGVPASSSRCASGCAPGGARCAGTVVGGVPSGDGVEVRVSVGPNGRVVSAPAGIVCGDVCVASFPADKPVWLQAVPDEGYEVDDWSAPCVDPNPGGEPEGCALAMTNGDIDVGVSFRPAD